LRDFQTPTSAALYLDKNYERSSGADARKRADYAEQLYAKDYRERVARMAKNEPTATAPEVVMQPIEPTITGALVEPPPLKLQEEADEEANQKVISQLIQSQIQSEAAMMAAVSVQQQVNVVSSETIKLRSSVEEEQSFPSSKNPDLEEYIQDAIISTVHTSMDI